MKKREQEFYLYYSASSSTLDRLSHKRLDASWIKHLKTDQNTRYIPIWKSENLFKAEDHCPVFGSWSDIRDIGLSLNNAVFLGHMDNEHYFAFGVDSPDALETMGKFNDLKIHAPHLDGNSCALLAYARAMIGWHHQTRFCGKCGSPTQSCESGHMLICTHAECRTKHFPRTDPAVIVLVTHEDRCLLARQPWWPDKLFSILAGYVEPAESFEETVLREVHEEAGIQLQDLQYITSQPWPFPQSIMIGYTAAAKDPTLHIDHEELEEARWFSRNQLKSELSEEKIQMPSITSVAYYLIAKWYDGENTGALDRLLGRDHKYTGDIK